MEGFVRIDDNCIEYNACNVKHRKLSKDSPVEPCHAKEATCKQTGSGSKSKDYECECQDGYFNEFGKNCSLQNKI